MQGLNKKWGRHRGIESKMESFLVCESLENVEKLSYVLGSELWGSKFGGLLSLVKGYILDVWEISNKLYDSDSGSVLQFPSQTSPGERNGKFGQNGKLG